MAQEASQPPRRTTTLVVFGDDPCPTPQGDEIVVCAREPESERYRIPEELRDKDPERRQESSWGSRVAALEEENRVTMPGSCSVVGSGGQSGCTQQMIRQWYAERRALRRR
jgi:hypothetical protein